MLAEERLKYRPPIPQVLKHLRTLSFKTAGQLSSRPDIQPLFPHTYGRPVMHGKQGTQHFHAKQRVGVVFSGGPAPGGHNVILGLLYGLQEICPQSQLYGFLDGPSGIIQGTYQEITPALADPYFNQGGFDLLGSGRTKIETEEQLQNCLGVFKKLELDALVIIGGDDSNTNAAVLAEYLLKQGSKTSVIGIPKTIDGDLQHNHLPVSFGFDTACHVYSELIGNLARDARSAKKYTHFVRLMGRTASHIALECALSTHPNLTFITEEVKARQLTFQEVTRQICAVVEARAKRGKQYGVLVIPEGLIEVFSEEIQKSLLQELDSHGNLNVSGIETEKLLMNAVSKELKARSSNVAFNPVSHFFGYEGRSAFPSNFDATYCYALGRAAATFAQHHLTGYMCCIEKLTQEVSAWEVTGVPITSLLGLELRKGHLKPVIQKALVNLEGKPFQFFAKHRDQWAVEDAYLYPGPIQFSTHSFPQILADFSEL